MQMKNFFNRTTNKHWQIEIDGQAIRTCLNGGKIKEIWNWDVGAEFRISVKKARITRPAPLI